MEIRESIRGALEPPVTTAPASTLPGDPLHLLTEHVRDHPRMDAAAFVVVDPARSSLSSKRRLRLT